MDISTKNILKIVRIGCANSIRKDIVSEVPINKNNYNKMIYNIKINKWYHDFFRKLKIRLLKYIAEIQGKCVCDCHFIPGFYHCFTPECCKEPNKLWYKK